MPKWIFQKISGDQQGDSAVGSFINRGGGTTNRMSISASFFFSISAKSGRAMTPHGPLLATTLSQLVNLSKL